MVDPQVLQTLVAAAKRACGFASHESTYKLSLVARLAARSHPRSSPNAQDAHHSSHYHQHKLQHSENAIQSLFLVSLPGRQPTAWTSFRHVMPPSQKRLRDMQSLSSISKKVRGRQLLLLQYPQNFPDLVPGRFQRDCMGDVIAKNGRACGSANQAF